jgi:ATP-binding cassette subfamily F protein 3
MADRTFFGTLFGIVGIIAHRPARWKRKRADAFQERGNVSVSNQEEEMVGNSSGSAAAKPHLSSISGSVLSLFGIQLKRVVDPPVWRMGYNPPRDPMSLIAVKDLAKSYGAQDVFEGVTVAVPHQARIALVGPNGVGKTTLLRLLADLEKPDQGHLQRARTLKIGFLPQEASYSNSHQDALSQSLWDSGLLAFDELRKIEAELTRLEQSMADPRDAEEAIIRYGPLQESFEHQGGYTYPTRIRRVLNGLGFEARDFSRVLNQLSGGERTRAFLAKLLLEDPDLLILDEPTNHLDIDAIEWLEGWIRDWPGAAVIVSHDRYFLDRTVDTIWELSPRGVEIYKGTYSDYAHQRIERSSDHERRYRAQQGHIRREEEYIRRNIAGQNTRQAQGRRKRLERLIQQEGLTRLREPSQVRIDFGNVSRSGDHVLETQELVIGYPDSNKALFKVPDLLLQRGECVALIGPNGAGKTTFLKTLLGEHEPLEGEVRFGASLQVGYFAQAHGGLNPEKTVIKEILDGAPNLMVSQARDFLGRFLFSGDSIQKTISVLSGGERGRVALAKLVLEGANLLLLDEPTNHLDIPSQEVLEDTLQTFPGTILLVSHDRYLIDTLATQLWVVTPSERALEVHSGGYQEFLERRRQKEAVRKKHREEARARKKTGGEVPEKAEVESVEARIEAIEQELALLSSEFEDAGSDLDEVRRIGIRYAALESDLETQVDIWEKLVKGEG